MDSDGYLSQLADIFNGITVNTPSISAIIAIVLAGVLLLASGFASASEIAFFSLSPSDRNDIDERNHPSDDKISALLGDTERLLATILITNNFVNVTIIMLCNFFFMNVFVFHSPLAEFLILTVILTFLLLLFGEIMPKIYSAQKTLAFCRFSAPGIYFLEKVFRPIATVLVRSTTFLNKHFVKKSHNISVDELSHALELTDKAELSEENNILEGIIRFGGETVKEVMTSRLDMVDLDIRTSFKEVMQCIIENAYSRIPIYSGSRDNIKGVLYIKDLLPHVNKGDNFRWQSLIRPAYFVPETKMIDDLLGDFQANKIHIAVVVDEFGGTSGIVTMEDILEEARGLAASGVKELNLVAQDTTRYGQDLYGEYSLDKLLTELCKIDGFHWIRVLYGYPDRVTDSLLEVMAREPKGGKYIDLPLQHASGRVLKEMNRNGNFDSLCALMQRIRSKVPGVVLRTTLIAGFPGETEEDFAETEEFARRAGFLHMHIFPFSPRKGTEAASMPEQVPENIKTRRASELAELGAVLADVVYEANRDYRGTVLFETYENGINRGHTEHMLEAELEGDDLRGKEVRVYAAEIKNDRLICKAE